ncbi:MAG: hypothetical protein ABI792_05810, partial [bacterium]
MIYLAVEYYITNGQMGVPLDDTWIHFQFAENFSKGYFFQYNIGEPTAGTTSPLYVIVLGTVGSVINNFILSSLLISSLFYLFCCMLVYKISLLIFESKHSFLYNRTLNLVKPKMFTLLSTLLTIFAGRFVWSGLSGMETTMFTFFCLLAVFFHLKNLERNIFTILPSLLFAFAALSRPEGFLLYFIYIVLELNKYIMVKRLNEIYIKLLLSIIIFICLTIPYFLFSYHLSGNFLPNTFRGQGGNFNFVPDFNYLRISILFFFRDNFITGLLYVSAAIYYLKNVKKKFNSFMYLNLIFLWIIFLPLVSSIVIPNW